MKRCPEGRRHYCGTLLHGLDEGPQRSVGPSLEHGV
jgi:hypothetical protein